MRKMLLRDVVFLIFSQVGIWLVWFLSLNSGQTDGIGASIRVIINILVFLLDGFFIIGMMSWFYIRNSQKMPAIITGVITLIGLIFFASLASVLFG